MAVQVLIHKQADKHLRGNGDNPSVMYPTQRGNLSYSSLIVASKEDLHILQHDVVTGLISNVLFCVVGGNSSSSYPEQRSTMQ